MLLFGAVLKIYPLPFVSFLIGSILPKIGYKRGMLISLGLVFWLFGRIVLWQFILGSKNTICHKQDDLCHCQSICLCPHWVRYRLKEDTVSL